MAFSEATRSYSETRKRSSNEYVKFTDEYRTVLRILNENAKTAWKHWVQVANGGKGMTAVCPNTSFGMNVCPIDAEYAELPRDNEDRKAAAPRRKFIVNVLDRTPYATCNTCNTPTPGKKNPAGTGKVCVNCGEILKGVDFKPLNRVKILEQGPTLFKQLDSIEETQKEDLGGVGITGYDITFTSQGKGRDRTIFATPQDPSELEPDALIDPETGEEQKLFDLELLTEPTSSEEIILMLQGYTVDQLNAVRGVS